MIVDVLKDLSQEGVANLCSFLERLFNELMKIEREQVLCSAVSGNITMQILLGKNMPGQSSKHEIQGNEQPVIQVVHYGDKNSSQWKGT